MKVIVAGSRGIKDYSVVLQAIKNSKFDITEIVSGTAIGVDRLGEQYARQFDIPIKAKPADWGEYGNRAGMMRNSEMAIYADAAVIIWDGKSKGTKHMIDSMIKLKKPYYLTMASLSTLESFMG
jgi:hypothetical protein